jgi:hypothetical protein
MDYKYSRALSDLMGTGNPIVMSLVLPPSARMLSKHSHGPGFVLAPAGPAECREQAQPYLATSTVCN